MNKYALACALLSSMTSILLGYDGAVISGASLFIKDDLKLIDTQIEILLGIIDNASLLGCVTAGRTSNHIGCHYTVILAAIIFFAGALFMGLAPNYAVLMLGRLVAGVGMGYSLMIDPSSPPSWPPPPSGASSLPFLQSSSTSASSLATCSFAMLLVDLNWRVMFLAGAVPPIFLIFGVLAMSESPRWLLSLDEAKCVLQKTSDSFEEAKSRLEDIIEAVGPTSKRDRGEGVWKELLIRPTPHARHVLIAAVRLQFF